MRGAAATRYSRRVMAAMRSWPSKDRLPPLWLSAAALTAAITVAFGLMRWVDHFVSAPYAEDFRVTYVAAEIGLSRGWSHIYDLDLQRQLSAGFGPQGSVISSDHNFVAPPLLAWLVTPLTLFPLPAAYLIWTIGSLAALIASWWLVCPGKGLVRVTLLLIALALYPVHYAFWLGQPVVITIACLALTWWLLERGRWAPAGVVMAFALFLKPQLLLLLPVALFVSGRWKPVLYCATAGGILGVLSLASLGSHGIASYANDVAFTNSNPVHSAVTYGYLFGRGPVATGVEVAAGLVALALAWFRRERMVLVFALGIVGSTASAFYFHEYDPAVLLLPAWLVLGNGASLPQRAWLLVGIAAAQFISIGQPIPMLFWEAGWIGMLGMEPWLAGRVSRAGAPPQIVRAREDC
jgi:Glycosyltransferase family 87